MPESDHLITSESDHL